MFLTDTNKHITLGKAFLTDAGKHVELSKVFVTDGGAFKLLWGSSTIGGKFFSARHSNEFYQSTDGINWTALENSPSSSPTQIGVSTGYFDEDIALVPAQTTVYKSTNLSTWTSATAPGNFSTIIRVNGVFYAASTAQYNILMKSTDGLTWTTALSETSATTVLAHFNGKFYKVTGNKLYTSTDFSKWTLAYTPVATNCYMYGIGYINNTVTILCNYGTQAYNVYSTDNGVTWTLKYLFARLPVSGIYIAEAPGKLITTVHGSIGGDCKVIQTTNGINWTEVYTPTMNFYKGAKSSGGRIMFIDNSGANVLYTDNGVNFTQTTTALNIAFRAIYGA